VSVVLDTSLRQEQTAAVLGATLAGLAPGSELSVFAAGDGGVIELVSDRRFEPALGRERPHSST
jgi:hypothetical protein